MSFRKAFLAFIACGAMLAASSCIDRGGEDLIVNITTSVGEDGIEFDMNAQDTTFTLTSNCDWTVEMEVENPWEDEAEVFEQNPWLTVTPTSGKASDQPVSVIVTAEANISDADEITYDRAVIVYFRTDREQFASVRVFQAGKERKPNAADTISISELRQMAPASQDSVVTITDPLIIKGVVVSSRDPQTVSNNNIYVQDGTGPHSGLLVYSSAFSSCNFGDVVEITVTDGTLEYYFGQLELKPASPDDLVVVDKVENPEAAEIEGASLVNGDYEGQYVKMYAQVVQGDLEKTMGDSPSIETEDGSSFLMYSRTNTPWADEEVPQGAGTVYGLVGSYNGDMAKRDSMHNAQCLAGMAFSNALLGIVHSMAHKTGAAFADYGAHIIHGAANAMYLPKVIAFNAKDPTAKKRYGEIADFMALGGKDDDEKVALLITYLRGMNDQLNIPHCIGHYGADSYPTEQGFVPEDVFLARLPEIAKNAIGDACTGSNPRQPSQEEMEKLLKCCYYDTEVDF